MQSLISTLYALDIGPVETLAGRIKQAYRVYVLGNGGSWSNAQHLLLHLRDAGIRAHDLLGDPGWLTATANDYTYDFIGARRLDIEASATDTLVVISGSGDSDNVVQALIKAETIGMMRLGLLGMGGGKAKALCTDAVVVASDDYGVIEDCHAAVIHMLSRMV